MMFIYLISRETCGYDEADAFVVAAASEAEARDFVVRLAGDKGPAGWSEGKATVTQMGTLLASKSSPEPFVILESFNFG